MDVKSRRLAALDQVATTAQESPFIPHSEIGARKMQLTKKQKKARGASKAAGKARRKNRK